MKKKLVFHVGPPKTGSSFIQKKLLEYSDHLKDCGIFYPHHNLDNNGISSGNVDYICTRDASGIYALDFKKYKACKAAFLASEFHTLLFSSEAFFRGIEQIFQLIPDASFVIYVRNPIEFHESIYNQAVKRHGKTSIATFPTSLPCAQWNEILSFCSFACQKGQKNRLALLPHSVDSSKLDIFERFSELLPFQWGGIHKREIINSSYSFSCLELKRWLNQFSLDTLAIELDEYLQKISHDAELYRLIPDSVLNPYLEQAYGLVDSFSRYLKDEDRNSLLSSMKQFKARPFLNQHDSGSHIFSELKRMSTENKYLYTRLNSLIKKEKKQEIMNFEYVEFFKR
jgi:hypothetical protein